MKAHKTAQAKAVRPDVFEWQPAELIQRGVQPSHEQRPELDGFALIVLNQPLPARLGVIRNLWDNAHIRIAADGGANCLHQAAGQHGDRSFDDLALIIGDLDSLTPQARDYYESRNTEVIRDTDQESTDFGKAVAYIRKHYYHSPELNQEAANTPLDIVAVGGLGGRVDQGVSQLHHLYRFQAHERYAEGKMYLFTGESLTFLLKPGKHRIRVRDGPAEEADVFGKYVGILPVGGPSVITTKGLEWDVTDWETQFGGQMSTSNHVLPETEVVEVETTRDVLWTIALKEA